jgi:tRNA(Ile)-lysidine synthase
MTTEAQDAPLFDRAALHPAALAVLEASAAREENWLIAFSGGADSLAVLLTVSALWPRRRSRLIAAHFNHALRGAESDADETFCEQIAREAEVEFVTDKWIQPPAGASEAEARAARFEFFSRVARAKDCRVLLTGHHLNDVLETFFMRLARGASAAGLAAPRPVRLWREGEEDVGEIAENARANLPASPTNRFIVRPLLSQPANEIRRRLAAAGRGWREDASNQRADFLRNRIRHDVVPAWLHAAGEGAFTGAALTRAWLEEDDAALETWLDELGIQKSVTRLPLEPLKGKPRALRRRALRRWRGAESLSRTGFDALIALTEKGEGQISAGEGWARVEAGQRVGAPRDANESPVGNVSVSAPASVFLPDGARIEVQNLIDVPNWRERLALRNIDPRSEALIALPASASAEGADSGTDPAHFSLTIRFWRSGDRYAPLGLGGSAKLQDLFVNRKIAPPDRHRLPVITGPDGQILWVPGFSPATHCRLAPETVWGVQLTYRGGTSTVSQQSLSP